MGRRFTVLFAGMVSISACSLITDLGGLGSSDASTNDVTTPEASPDVTQDVTTSDVSDAATDACPTITRVQLKSNGTTSLVKNAQVTLDVTQGDLLVAVLGAQFNGILNVSDSASNAWTMPNGEDNFNCVNGDAAPWATRTRIAYATVLSTMPNDVVTFSTTGGGNDYLALVVAEYSSTKPLVYLDTKVGIAGSQPSSVVTTNAFDTIACTSLIVAMLGDEYPLGDIWTPFSGFTTIAEQSDWAYVAVDDTNVPPGVLAPGASHTKSDTCWAATAVAFSPQ
jgi:hypothetical protein